MRETWLKMEDWAKRELIIINIFMFGGIFMTNVILKLQGLYLSLIIISILATLHKTNGILVNIFKNIKTGTKYLLLINAGIIRTFIHSLYFYMDTTNWLILSICFDVVLNVIISSFYIDYDTILKDLVSTKMFKEIQYIEKLCFSIVGIVGGLISILLAAMFDVDLFIKIIIVIEIIGIIYSFNNYKVFKNIKLIEEGSIEHDTKIFVKMSLNEYKNKDDNKN